MAYWNELILTCNLKWEAPQEVLDILSYLVTLPKDEATGEIQVIETPNHSFFKRLEWQYLFHQYSVYFPGERVSLFDPEFKRLTLRIMVRADEELIADFLRWLAPHSETQGFVGYTRCDETPDILTIIEFNEDDVFYTTMSIPSNDNLPPKRENISQ